MLIRSSLFSSGRDRPDLHALLHHHQQQLLNRITAIASLDEMTDVFLTRMIEDALVRPLSFQKGQMYRETRTEHLGAEFFPDRWARRIGHGQTFPKTVVRISIPFSGDPALLQHRPNWTNFHPPMGEVNGGVIQFDVALLDSGDDQSRAAQQIKENIESIELYASHANAQVKAFNESLSPVVTAAFNAKLDRLTAQHAIFDGLGIPEKPAPVYHPTPSVSAPPKVKRSGSRREQIIHLVQQTFIHQIETMNVDTLNQTNHNAGDVSNSIQSS